jgi:hypothetical protein
VADPAPSDVADSVDAHCYTVKEINEIGECVRRWACSRVHRIPQQKTPAMQAGIDVHDVLSAMLRQGPTANLHPETDVGKWARALYPMAPVGAHSELEHPFEIDLRHLTGVATDVFKSNFKLDFVPPDFTGFGDFKTCAGPNWAVCGPGADAQAQQTGLADDLQANVETYGFTKVMGFGDRPASLQWLYVDKKTLKTWQVRGALGFKQAEAWIAKNALPRMRLIRGLRALATAGPMPVEAYPHDLTACTPNRPGQPIRCNYLGQCQMRQTPNGLTTEKLYQLVR